MQQTRMYSSPRRKGPLRSVLELLKEVQMGHTAGPFTSPPFPNLQVYPIGVVLKKHSTDRRTIFHLSYPKHHSTSVNANISPSDYSLHYITSQRVASRRSFTHRIVYGLPVQRNFNFAALTVPKARTEREKFVFSVVEESL